MALGFHSHRNAPPDSAGHSNPDALGDSSGEGLKPWIKAQMKQARRQPRILETSPSHALLGILRTSSHAPHTHIPCGLRVARLPEAASLKNTSGLSDKKGHYATKCPEPRKNRGYSRTSSANKFRASDTLPPSEKNLCRLYSTQEVRLMPYTLPSLRN